MLLLVDIGNSNTHVGLADEARILRTTNLPTSPSGQGEASERLQGFINDQRLTGAAFCSVVPNATQALRSLLDAQWNVPAIELKPGTLIGIDIDYPKPDTIGPDRLANAMAVVAQYGAPAVVVDFGTAVTFDVVDASRNYIGGIIAPGLSAMTGYLHEKTALLPAIEVREIDAVVGKSTEEAMLIGAVHGYRSLIQGLLAKLKNTLNAEHLKVVATGGHAELVASRISGISAIEPLLTLNGLHLLGAQTFLKQR